MKDLAIDDFEEGPFRADRWTATERSGAWVELAAGARRFLDQYANLAATRETIFHRGSAYDEYTWRRLAEEFAATCIHIPEVNGGEGFGFEELAVLLSETGRVLYPSPLFSSATMATGFLLEQTRNSEDDELLTKLAKSEVTATVALVEPGGGWEPQTIRMMAEGRGSTIELRGEKIAVLDATAAVILTIARRPGSSGNDGLLVAEVERTSPGLETRDVASLDSTRPLHSLRFNGVRARMVGDPDGSYGEAISAAMTRSVVGLAAEMVGGARQCVESAVTYSKARRQFGGPIGSFQAIKHICADMLVEIELAHAIVMEAIEAVGSGAQSSARLASIAKLQATRAYLSAALGALHVHGAMGFTLDHDIHLFVRRAKWSDLFLGNRQFHRQRIAQDIGLVVGASQETVRNA